MLWLKELARKQQWKDSDMQGVLKALGIVSYCLRLRKMLDDFVKGKIVIVRSLGDPQFLQVRKRKDCETI